MKRYTRIICFIMITGILMLFASCGTNGKTFEKLLPKGVKLGMTENEVIKILGEPAFISDSKVDYWEGVQFNKREAAFSMTGEINEHNPYQAYGWLIPLDVQDEQAMIGEYKKIIAYLEKTCGGKLLGNTEVPLADENDVEYGVYREYIYEKDGYELSLYYLPSERPEGEEGFAPQDYGDIQVGISKIDEN